jgi:predicted PurR-regulated permease PerM
MTPDTLTGEPIPPPPKPRDSEVADNAAGGPAPLPEVVVNRSTVAELERRRMLHLQSVSMIILAIAALMTLIWVAKLILVVVLIAVLLAFVLAPLVDALWRARVPRAFGALVAVTLLMGALAATTYFSYNHALDFAHELPRYKSHIQALTSKFRKQAETLSQTTETVLPGDKAEKNAIVVRQASSWTDLFSPGVNSLTEAALAVAFIPFLVYFMLSWQDHVRAASVMLFKMENRNTAYVMLGLIAAMIRSFIVGNFIIGLFLSAGSIVIFGLLHLPYFYFLGVISGFLSLVPYLGVILAVIPPLITDLGHLNSGNSIIIIGTVLGLHLMGMNVLYPKILGKRLSLNPLAVTLSLLFWGWLWGAMGLILAVPIMGAAKIIFDHVERLRPYGAWLGE